MNISELDAPKRSRSFSNIPRLKRIKKRKVALNRFMERNPNALLRSYHKIPKNKRCKLIKNALRVEERISETMIQNNIFSNKYLKINYKIKTQK